MKYFTIMAVSLIVIPGLAHAAEVTVAQYDGPTTGSAFPGEYVLTAQTFTAEDTGLFASMSARVARNLPDLSGYGQLWLQLRTTSGGVPTSSVLATGSIDPAQTPGWVTVDYSGSSVMLYEDQVYALSLASPLTGPRNGGPVYVWPFSSADPYKGGGFFASYDSGSTWINDIPEYDALFRITVTSVPETSALLYFVAGSVSILAFRRRSKDSENPPPPRRHAHIHKKQNSYQYVFTADRLLTEAGGKLRGVIGG